MATSNVKVEGFTVSLDGIQLDKVDFEQVKPKILAAVKRDKASTKHAKHSLEWQVMRAIVKSRQDDAKRQAILLKTFDSKAAKLIAAVKENPSEGAFAMAHNCSGELARTLFGAAETANLAIIRKEEPDEQKRAKLQIEQTATYAALRSAGIAAGRDKPGYNKGEPQYGPQGASNKGSGRSQRSDDIASLLE